jgi:hypothetical protein
MKISVLFLLIGLLVSGCATTKPGNAFATPDQTWETHIGQLKYSDARRTLIGDVVVRQRGEQEFQLDFQKVGGIPLLMLREDATTARAEGLFARGSWQGPPDTAPKYLRSWVALREAFRHPTPVAGKAGDQRWQGTATSEGGQLESVSLSFLDENQHFVFQFNH